MRMTLRCPACGKVNDLASGEPICQRCACDLSLLVWVVDSALRHLQAASAEFRAREWESALWHAEQSWNLLHTPSAARSAFLASAAVGDTAKALQWLPRSKETGETGKAG